MKIRIFSSIGSLLVAVVLFASIGTFGLIGTLTVNRLNRGLDEQASALQALSEQQIANRLVNGAKLASARLDSLFNESSRSLTQLAQRTDIAQAIATTNDVTIGTSLRDAGGAVGLDILIAFDNKGNVIGTNTATDLLAIQSAITGTPVTVAVNAIATSKATRQSPYTFENTYRLNDEILGLFNLPPLLTLGHLSARHVFDDFGDPIGILVGIRNIATSEATLEQYAALSHEGVMLMLGTERISSAGPEWGNGSFAGQEDKRLITSQDGEQVARCMPYVASTRLCTFAPSSLIARSRDQMLRIGSNQTKDLMFELLVVSAVAIAFMLTVLLVSVRRSTRGLPDLALAAGAIADGDLEVNFRADGMGEVHSLGTAFERMLDNLRTSVGRIRQLAYYDGVTGLPNREKIQMDVNLLFDAVSASETGAVLFIDLDRFKIINDTFGHNAGDALLKQVGDRFSEFFNQRKDQYQATEVILARIGGDEFVAVLEGIPTREEAARCAAHLIDLVRLPFDIAGSRVTIGASIGIAHYPEDGRDYETLLQHADLAMYAAKKKGRNTYELFNNEIAKSAHERMLIEKDLEQAIANDTLEVFYQPKVSCADARIVGAEALVRWKHPHLGYVRPDKFIGIAEEAGLISGIGRFVLKRTIQEIGAIIAAGNRIRISVNVSPVELEDPHYPQAVEDLLKTHAFPADCLELEITESMMMRDPEVVRKRMMHLRELGVHFSIDDFGTGYSNLATLASLPVDTVKLDRSLITNITTDANKQTITTIIIGLARQLGFSTVVEGVETPDEFNFTANIGADMVQGFLFSPAVPILNFRALLDPAVMLEKMTQVSRPAAKPKRTNLRLVS